MNTTLELPDKTCLREGCNNLVPRYWGKGENLHLKSPTAYKSQLYCSRACRNADLQAHIEPTKICERCKKEFSRPRISPHAFMSNSGWKKQKYCSRACFLEAVAEGSFRVTRDKKDNRPYREYLKPACESCQATKKLEGHHIDGDHSNDVPENIQTLCSTCHAFWHRFTRKRGWLKPGRMPDLATAYFNQGDSVPVHEFPR